MSRETLRAALEGFIRAAFMASDGELRRCFWCELLNAPKRAAHDERCPVRIVGEALAAEAAEPVRRALPDTVRCPTHCTLPDTGDVRLCPCTGECERCNELRNVEPAAAPPGVESAQLAQQFHEAYERLAPSFGYATRRESAVPWEQVPEANRRLMEAVASEVMSAHAAALREVTREREMLEDTLAACRANRRAERSEAESELTALRAKLAEAEGKAHDEYLRGVETGKNMRRGLATEIERLRAKLAEVERELLELRKRAGA